jgi:hypothetical protein
MNAATLPLPSAAIVSQGVGRDVDGLTTGHITP